MEIAHRSMEAAHGSTTIVTAVASTVVTTVVATTVVTTSTAVSIAIGTMTHGMPPRARRAGYALHKLRELSFASKKGYEAANSLTGKLIKGVNNDKVIHNRSAFITTGVKHACSNIG